MPDAVDIQFSGRDHDLPDPARKAERLRLSELPRRYKHRGRRHGKHPVAELLVRSGEQEGGIHPARERNRKAAEAAQALSQRPVLFIQRFHRGPPSLQVVDHAGHIARAETVVDIHH